MATRKKTKAEDTQAADTLVSVDIGGIEFGCKAPTVELWDRYLQLLSKGEEHPARRTVVVSSCSTHDHEGASKILDRFPALAATLSNALDAATGGDMEPHVDVLEGLVSFDLAGSSFVLNGPNLDKWESFQTALGSPRVKLGPTMREFVSKLCDNPQELKAAIEKRPASIGPIVAAVGQLAGTDFEVKVKKD